MCLCVGSCPHGLFVERDLEHRTTVDTANHQLPIKRLSYVRYMNSVSGDKSGKIDKEMAELFPFC